MECYCPKCDLRLAIGQPHKCPAPKEEEMICKHCSEPITCKDGKKWVNAGDKGNFHDNCFDKAIIKPAERTAERRALARDAYMAALGGLCAGGNLNVTDTAGGAAVIALETVRRWDSFLAAVDAEGGE